MNVDCYFSMGKTHLVCEDYALATEAPVPGVSEPVPTVPFIVLSDGCSSSPNTDLGARLLCLNSLRFMEYLWMQEDFNASQDVVERIVWAAVVSAAPLHPKGSRLDTPSCVDATLLMAAPHAESIRVVVAGDGVVCARRRDGVVETYQVSFNGNAPGYPSYIVSPSRIKTYLENHGHRKVESFIGRERVEILEERLGFDMSSLYNFVYTRDFPQAEYDLVVLFSDGVESFHRKQPSGNFEPVELFDVLDQLMALRNTTGQFVVRRMRRFLRKFCPQNNWHHNDDLAMAAIYQPEVP